MTTHSTIHGVSALALAAALLTTLPTAASAHDEGVYVRGQAGYGVHQDPELTGDLTSLLHGNGLQSEGGAALSLGVGYEFDNNWRLELDGDTLFTDLGSISQIPNTFGKLRTDSLMLNLLYDFENFGRWEPYVGAGLGLVRGDASFAAHDFAVNGVVGANPACSGARGIGETFSCQIDDKDTSFGWQLMAGLGYALSDNLTWDTQATYINAGSLDLEGTRSAFAGGVNTSAINSNLSDIGAYSVLTGLRYRFGHDHARVTPPPPPPPPPPAPIPEPATFTCWDGSSVLNAANCPAQPAPAPLPTYTCWDGSIVADRASCPVQPAPEPVAQTFVCADGATIVSDLSACPVVQASNLNVCTNSPVKIFDVPASTTFEQVPRLGTMPEFGDSHDLSPSQFYDKLNSRYASNASDKAYLNYLFRSMGYANGWRDARPDMFSNDVIPAGTRGILGLGAQHHFEYKILPTGDRDRQAFRIQSANGQVVHFMKTCGNYFYGCQ